MKQVLENPRNVGRILAKNTHDKYILKTLKYSQLYNNSSIHIETNAPTNLWADGGFYTSILTM